MRAASVVTRDVPDCAVAVGNPARVFYSNKERYIVVQKCTNIYRILFTGEIMEILNISYSTIKVYDKNGTLPIKRTGTGRRAVFREDLLNYLDSKGLLYDDTETVNKHDVIYARVSSHEQEQKGDLERQAVFLLENVHDLHNPIIMKEVGSGLNDRRRKLQELMVMVLDHKVSRVFVEVRVSLSGNNL